MIDPIHIKINKIVETKLKNKKKYFPKTQAVATLSVVISYFRHNSQQIVYRFSFQ